MRSSADVEAEVEASRSELDRNVEALKQKMTPGQLFDETARIMGGAGQKIGAKFVEQARANPMPLAVMGLGLAWLMMSHDSGGPAGAYGERRSFAGYGEDDAPGMTDRVRDGLRNATDKAQDLMADAKDRVTGAAGSMADGGRSAAHAASAAAHQAQQKVSDAFHAEPLLLAGLGLVVGAAIGAALPSTDAESRLFGDARDKLMEKGKDLAETGLDKAGDVAQAAVQAVKSELGGGEEKGGEAQGQSGLQ